MNNKISVGTITRTLLLVIALINQILTVAGYSPLPFDDETVTQAIAVSFTIITSVISWWKNNSFTKKAIEADTYKNDLKAYVRQERE